MIIGILIVLLIVLILGALAGLCSTDGIGSLACILGAIIAVVALTCVCDDRDDAYREGQIDSANGIVKYELVKRPNGETLWVRKATTQP